MATAGVQYLMGVQPNDIIYSALPLYHGSGSMLGIPQAFMYGTPVAMRKKFSASNFWKDCIKYNCTVYKTNYRQLSDFSSINIDNGMTDILDCPVYRRNLQILGLCSRKSFG